MTRGWFWYVLGVTRVTFWCGAGTGDRDRGPGRGVR
uniref:Uncharacterized protein n=1 Tax=Siphoviridae sp. ctLfk13 TaxID=2826251 RepID=A0A8S5N1D5_9CAUD|nr:MAG TPA: hypothetical protein [Siphoviridae sp. ctLfk13]